MPSSADDLDGQEEGSRSQSRDPQLPNKRKADEESDADSNQKPKANKKPRVNTAVYVTGIPSDAKWDEVHDFFKRFGIIALNPETEEPRVKLYNDDEGAFKGEALISTFYLILCLAMGSANHSTAYFKPESINNAIMLADGSDFRSLGDGDLHIQPAEFTHKPDKVANKQQKQQQKQQSGPRKAGSNAQYIEKVKQVNQRLNRKLAEWSDDDIEPEETEKKPRNKFDKFVIVRNMFTAEVLEVSSTPRRCSQNVTALTSSGREGRAQSRPRSGRGSRHEHRR